MSHSSTSRNGSIAASRLSLEAQMERYFMLLEGEVACFAREKKTYLLALFAFVCGSEGDRATSPSSASRNGPIDASKASLEAQMERDFMQLAGEIGHSAHGKKSQLAILSFVHGAESDEATSSSFVAENTTIGASNSSLEALGAT